MKAVGIRRYGAAGVLEMWELPKPTPAPNQVLVRVVAAGVNPADWRLRNGQFRFFIKLPFVLGADVAGVVEAVGAAVTRFRPGDAVYALLATIQGGGYAEYVAINEAMVAAIPPKLTFAEAAATPLTALTALQALRDKAKLQPSARLLVNGASGGVGSFAVQIGKALGAHVTGVCSGRNAALVSSLGADTVLDYTAGAPLSGAVPYDVIFDTVNTLTLAKVRHALVHQGALISVNPLTGNPLSAALARLRGRQLKSVLVQPSGADLERLTAWVMMGRVRPVIDRCYPLPEAAVAHCYSETGRVRGKLVLVVDETLAHLRVSDTAFSLDQPAPVKLAG